MCVETAPVSRAEIGVVLARPAFFRRKARGYALRRSRAFRGTRVALTFFPMSDRRDLPREARVTPVLCRVGNDTFDAVMKNLSAGGVFIETAWLFDPTQEITMVIDVPGRGSVSATGRPTRVIARKNTAARYQLGVAVQFVECALD